MKVILDKIKDAYDNLVIMRADVESKAKEVKELKAKLIAAEEKLNARENDINARARIVGNLESVSKIKESADAKAISNGIESKRLDEKMKSVEDRIKENKDLLKKIEDERSVNSSKVRALKEKEASIDKKTKGLKEGLLGKLAKELGV